VGRSSLDITARDKVHHKNCVEYRTEDSLQVLGCVKLKYTACPQLLEAGVCGMRGICSPYDWTGCLDNMTGDTALARWSTRWQRMDARPSEAINLSINQEPRLAGGE
jgi:hypothetical protein